MINYSQKNPMFKAIASPGTQKFHLKCIPEQAPSGVLYFLSNTEHTGGVVSGEVVSPAVCSSDGGTQPRVATGRSGCLIMVLSTESGSLMWRFSSARLGVHTRRLVGWNLK